MKTEFVQLNSGWNADPNAPDPRVELLDEELQLHFRLNCFQFQEFERGQTAILHFPGCWRYRLGDTNDEGWYRGQCRFSNFAPQWGEFYEVRGDLLISKAPNDWHELGKQPAVSRHFLFYLRDETFECDAMTWSIDLPRRPSPCSTG